MQEVEEVELLQLEVQVEQEEVEQVRDHHHLSLEIPVQLIQVEVVEDQVLVAVMEDLADQESLLLEHQEVLHFL